MTIMPFLGERLQIPTISGKSLKASIVNAFLEPFREA
jgi:hypothetical protein